jgi:hypothetical protein
MSELGIFSEWSWILFSSDFLELDFSGDFYLGEGLPYEEP